MWAEALAATLFCYRGLYPSPRTVSTHLHRLFPKLGVTTRATLRDALADLPSE
jgi:DNA-binding NarL/FixJ family response regulator